MSILETAKQVVARPDVAAGWYCAGCHCGVDPRDVTFGEAHVACGRVITDDKPEDDPLPALAAALVEADGHLSNLASMLEAAHRQLGIYSKENKRLVAARAFLSRISKEQDNG